MQKTITRWLALTLLLIIAAFLCSCSQETRKSFSELFTLRTEIAAQYQVPDVGVKLVNNKILIVSLINSQFNSLAEADQKAKAKGQKSKIRNRRACVDSEIQNVRAPDN